MPGSDRVGNRSAPEPIDGVPAVPLRSRIRGCLLGGALGDALGAPIEFLSLAEIRRTYGNGSPRGLDRLAPTYGRSAGAITDDTQMTLFTAEGLIRALVSDEMRGESRGSSQCGGNPPTVVAHAYARWLHTQGDPYRWGDGHGEPQTPDGWLVAERWLHSRRAPGTTCLAALREHRQGRPAENDSKGCGGVMRAAPVGLLPGPGTGSEPTPQEGVFRLAVEIAALTHGHPTGKLPAGVLAATIHGIARQNLQLPRALDEALRILRHWPSHEETLTALERARDLANQRGESGPPTAERVESLGVGWIAEEALAIAVYAALVHQDDFRAALVLAANHGGDSDSTAAICGNLLGALHGEEALPDEWLALLEGREAITRLGDDFFVQMEGRAPKDGYGFADEWRGRYPGW